MILDTPKTKQLCISMGSSPRVINLLAEAYSQVIIQAFVRINVVLVSIDHGV